MTMDMPSFDSLPSPFPTSSINTPLDTNVKYKDEPATSKTDKAEVYV